MLSYIRQSLTLKTALSVLLLATFMGPTTQVCLARRPAPPVKKVEVSEKPTLDLIELLGHHPELLTPEYLQYVLGRPIKRHANDGSNLVYHWQTNEGGIGTQDCELAETRDANRRITRAVFRVNLPQSSTTLEDVEKKISDDGNRYAANYALNNTPGNTAASSDASGPANPPPMTPLALTGRKLFDQECRPSLQYSFVPYTKVFYTQAQNTFHVHRAEIDYAGPPLPPPDQKFIAAVATDMRTRALNHHAGDMHHLAVPMLHDHLSENPADAEAHYALGLSYQRSSHLNEAISEYQLALRYSNGNDGVSSKAVQSLQDLHVLPSPDDRLDFHTLRFRQNGQGMTEGDVVASQDRRSMLAGQRPLYAQNAQNPMYPASPGSSYSPNSSAPSTPASHNSSQNYQPPPYNPPGGAPPISSAPSTGPSFANLRPPDIDPPQTASFYGSMQYGSNLFPASASNASLEPGF